jgi:uncharacterized membrane protein YfcA
MRCTAWFCWQNKSVDWFQFDADSVKNYSLFAMAGSFIGLLLVLKFAKSVVSKLLLLIMFVAIGVLAFTQRDAVNACIASAKDQAEAGTPLNTTCTFFGQEVSLSSITQNP